MQTIIQLQEVERLRRDGQLTEAYMLCKHAYDKHPDNIDVLMEMSALAIDLSHFSTAESLSRMALSQDPGRADLWEQLAQALSAQSNDSEAQKAENLSQLDEADYAKLRIKTAQQQLNNCQIDKAIILLETILSEMPEHKEALALLASIKQN